MWLASVVPDAPDDLYPSGLPVRELFGVPVHVLVAHSAVVLLPLAAIGLIFIATSITRSKRYGGAVALLAVLGFLASYFAVASGEDLSRAFGYADQQHFRLGFWVPWFGLAVTVAATLLWLLDKKPSKRGGPAKIIALVSFVVAAAAIALVAWTGLSGDQLTWAT